MTLSVTLASLSEMSAGLFNMAITQNMGGWGSGVPVFLHVWFICTFSMQEHASTVSVMNPQLKTVHNKCCYDSCDLCFALFSVTMTRISPPHPLIIVSNRILCQVSTFQSTSAELDCATADEIRQHKHTVTQTEGDCAYVRRNKGN